ncbi:unnamed protein product [Sphagnum balticum]
MSDGQTYLACNVDDIASGHSAELHYMQGQDDELLSLSRGRRALTFVSGTAENKCHQLAAAQNVQKTSFISRLQLAADVWGRQQARSPPAADGAAFEWALTTSAESMNPWRPSAT